jgi:hypothetical protein
MVLTINWDSFLEESGRPYSRKVDESEMSWESERLYCGEGKEHRLLEGS